MTSLRARLLAVLALASAVLGSPDNARAVEPGDLVLASRTGGIYVANPLGAPPSLLSGPYLSLEGFSAVVSDANGNIYAVSVGVRAPAAVVRIDAATGAQNVITSGNELVH